MPNTLNSHVFLRIPPYPQVHVHKYLVYKGGGGGVFLTEALQTQRERERGSDPVITNNYNRRLSAISLLP